MAKTHCAVDHHFRARLRVPHIPLRSTQPTPPLLSDIELLAATLIEQFCSFLALYLMLLGALFKIAFPFLPESIGKFQENDHD